MLPLPSKPFMPAPRTMAWQLWGNGKNKFPFEIPVESKNTGHDAGVFLP